MSSTLKIPLESVTNTFFAASSHFAENIILAPVSYEFMFFFCLISQILTVPSSLVEIREL